MNINPEIFRAYDVRGLYPADINPEVAYRLGRAFGKYLKQSLGKVLPFSVVVGLDMRGSSPFLAREAIAGLNDQGIDVVEIGKVPAPAFYYAVAFKDYAGGLMVTASHNPKEYNGFKFCAAKAVPVARGSGLEEIQSYISLEEIRDKPGVKGRVSSLENIAQEYVRQDLAYVNYGKIKKLKIVADTANAMGAVYLDELFKIIPGDLIRLNWELNGNMPIHEPNPLKIETLQQLQAVIKNEKADLGIATDGDGDRMALLDDQAEIIPPAIILGLVAQVLLKKYPGERIGYDPRLSRVAREMILEAGGEPIQTPVGHSLIKALMREKNILFSGELSSHYYFRENYNFESPAFVIAQLLLLRSGLDIPLSEIWQSHKKYYHSGEINFEVSDKQAALERLETKYADGRVSKPDGLKVEYDDWWFNARPSNTEPFLRLNLEADTEELMKQRLGEVSLLIKG